MSPNVGIAPTSPAAVSRVLNDNHIMGLSVTRVGANTANLPEDATLISGLADSHDLANIRRAAELLQRRNYVIHGNLGKPIPTQFWVAVLGKLG